MPLLHEFNLIYKGFKAVWFGGGKLCQHLSIHLDVFFLQTMN